MEMNIFIGRDVLLPYPNSSEEFIIRIDARKMQLRGLISQNGKTILFESYNLTIELLIIL